MVKTRHIISIALVALLSSLVHGQAYTVQSVSLNTAFSEHSPTVYRDGLVFMSNRPYGGSVAYVDSTGAPTSRAYFAPMDGAVSGRVRPFAEYLDTRHSEGAGCFSPDGKQFYFTRPLDNRTGSDSRLGIFVTRKSLGVWSEPRPFVHNAPNGTYDVAHPAISPDGKWLVFTSNPVEPSGHGDLYICQRTNGTWGGPQRMPDGVNQSGRECFPSFDHFGRLYFASDRQRGRQDLDIYYTMLNDAGIWVEPAQLPAPINSKSDDLSVAILPDGESGYVVSNREQDQDDLFYFAYTYPKFGGCKPAEEPALCYALEETTIQPIDSLPFRYYWDFGDGETTDGFYAEHCFPGTGSYSISFNIQDTVSGELYARVSETELVIEQLDRPFIAMPDTVIAGQPFEIEAKQTNSSQFEIDQFFWKLDDESRKRGQAITHTISTPGAYSIQLGALSIPMDGFTRKVCATRTVAVVEDQDWSPDPKYLPTIRELLARNNQDSLITIDDPVDSAIFFVEFAHSEDPLPLSDPFFDQVPFEITERYLARSDRYTYSVGNVEEIARLLNVYKVLKNSGYSEAVVSESPRKAFDATVERRGYYMPDSLRNQINAELNAFADIRFGYNSEVIEPVSLNNLRYIRAVLDMEPRIRVWIKAHTDDTGTAEFNQELSERRAASVRNWFVRQGVPRERFDLTGYGSSQPVASNETDEGRAQNRRVEFEIRVESKPEAESIAPTREP